MLTDTSLYHQARQALKNEILEQLMLEDLAIIQRMVVRYTGYTDEDHWLAQYWHTGE